MLAVAGSKSVVLVSTVYFACFLLKLISDWIKVKVRVSNSCISAITTLSSKGVFD